MRQIKLHNKIDALLLQDPKEVAARDVRNLIKGNNDLQQYFFASANERWLDWLWENGFLDVLKKKSEDPTRYRYQTSEVSYLIRIAGKRPSRVVDIILEIPVSTETFNPEVLDGFLRICSNLPANELKRVVRRISEDGWVSLMGAFDNWGFEYEKMFKILSKDGGFDSLLILAEAVLSIRTKEKADQDSGFLSDSPFYFRELSYTKVFDYLLQVDEEHLEKALNLVSKVVSKAVLFNEKEDPNKVFDVYDTFFLSDVDFFELEITEQTGHSYRDDVKNLVAVLKYYAEQTIGKKCGTPEEVNDLYNKYFRTLPDSRSMWRFRLFVLSLCPKAFKGELKKSLFKLFSVPRYYNEIISGAEYLKTLRIAFPLLSEDEKRDYIKKVVEYFTKRHEERENNNENWHLTYGSRILSIIPRDELMEEEIKLATEKGFKISANYEPEPSIGRMRAGTVRPKGPITLEEFHKLLIEEIAQNLRSKWAPKELSQQNDADDFLNPLNAEGAGSLLRTDIPSRLQDYVDNSNLFFERDVLDQHYTYSFLRGIQETLRNKKAEVDSIDWSKLVDLFLDIKKEGELKPFDRGQRERDSYDAWLSGWDGVHSAMNDVIEELINEDGGSAVIKLSDYRDQLFSAISYLLHYPDPAPKDEHIDTAGMKSGVGEESLVSDPYTMAINTTRGRAFQSFVLFVYQDGKKFSESDAIKINSEVKSLYEEVLEKENTRALMFMFGRYLPSFYFRDRQWILNLLPSIFPEDPEKKNLYTAAWEGYLSNNLYEELFFEPKIQELYERGLTLAGTDFPLQKFFRDPDEGMAVHVALAFMHYDGFGMDTPLFKDFWEKGDAESRKAFISFIGRRYVMGNLADQKNRKKLEELWDWILENSRNSDVVSEFGSWMEIEKGVFENAWLAQRIRKTLERTGGILDWNYELRQSILALAKAAPEDTAKILELYLLEGGVRKRSIQIPFNVGEWLQAFKTLYENPKTKSRMYNLIDDLIREGGRMFWELKGVIEGKDESSD